MLILQKYILKKFLLTLASILFVLIFLFVLVRFTERVNDFIPIASKTPFIKFVQYFVYEMPYTLNYLFPIACIFSLVYVLGKLNNDSELIIFYTTGRKFWLYLLPVFVVIFFICSILLIFDKELLYTPHQKHKVVEAELYGDSSEKNFQNINFVQFGSQNKIYMIEKFIRKTGSMTNVRILYLDEDNNFEKFVIAERAKNFESSVWELINFYSRKLVGGYDIQYSYEKNKKLDLGEEPYHFEKANFNPDDISSRDMYREAKKVERIGGNHKKLWTDFYFKTATPYIAIVMLFLALPLATYSKNSILVFSFFWVLIVAFAYIATMNIGVSLGHNGILPPLLAGWFGNIVFFTLSVGLYYRLRK